MSRWYAETHCLSNFSFLRGASKPEELVYQAHALGYGALAITDECSMAGVVRAHVAAKEKGLKLLIGSEIQLSDGPKLVLLATNRQGYGQICQLITQGRRRAKKGDYELLCDDLSTGLHDCLAILIPNQFQEAAVLLDQAQWLSELFPSRSWLSFQSLLGPDDDAMLRRLWSIAAEAGLPLVASGDVHYHHEERRRLQDILTCVRVGKPVHDAGHELFPNGERSLRPINQLTRLYPAELLAETCRIAELCNFSLDDLKYEYPDEIVPNAEETPIQYLKRLTWEGAAKRWPAGVSGKVRSQLEHELLLIEELRYECFFLTVYDVVAFAKGREILCQGRGSSANSAVCYCLGITEVDPARSDMLFERFVSKERNEPPDIDVDFEHQRREEVLQYIYEKYGRDRAAIAATVITYQPKSALRDVGKALGLDVRQLDALTASMAWWDRSASAIEDRLLELGLDPESRQIQLLLELTGQLIGFPRHLSQHVGGMVISKGLMSQLVPIENASMPDRTVLQWDKDDLDAMSLLKVDCLCLGMLSAIRRALDMASGFRGMQLRMRDIPPEDPEVYEMLSNGDSVGVFQVESRAQMAMLPRMQPRTFYDLVIEVAIVRPGPIQGGMVHPYLKRRQGTELVTYPSEAVKSVLLRTLGVPIFQEQVMQLAIVAAGFTPGEADQLRRSMAAWKRKGGLEYFQQRLMDGMAERGYSREFADQIFRQIQGFASYGFPESHSASFALLVYVSAWLKCHEPAAFLAGLLNSQPMGFYAPAQLMQDARRHGVEVRPVDVMVSGWDCTLERRNDGEPAVRLGLRMVKGLREVSAIRIAEARAVSGFTGIADIANRGDLNKRDLQCLAAANAFGELADHRIDAHWKVTGIEKLPPLLKGAEFQEQAVLFPAPSEGKDIVDDYASLGLTLGRHPVALLRERLKKLRLKTAEQIQATTHGQWTRAAGLVITRQRPETASGVIFLTMEDETGSINVIVHSHVLDRQRAETLGARFLEVQGELQREGPVIHLIARRLVDHSSMLGSLVTASRDFH